MADRDAVSKVSAFEQQVLSWDLLLEDTRSCVLASDHGVGAQPSLRPAYGQCNHQTPPFSRWLGLKALAAGAAAVIADAI
jgi:hypothetical protein